ncbi:MAG: type IV secretory system conjugative DNA transfer family protein [Clostridia bacterium]|nr:type IV secretory system conjugative DNA transfer family protein [Clostridia bacterium]
MKEIKRKFQISLLIFILGLIGNIYFSSALHSILAGQMKVLKLLPIGECVISIVTVKQHTILFLCFQGFATLLSILYLTTNNKPYQSGLREITPQIKTPVPAGQNQHGSAAWLTEKEMDAAFNSSTIHLNDKFINMLISNGYSDIIERQEEKEKEAFTQTNSGDMKAVKILVDPKKKLGYLPQGGIVLGLKKQDTNEKMYFVGDDIHTLCIGATRSGKSRTVVLQSICNLGLAAESMIISDPKGELWAYTSPFLKRLGYKVVTIDFKNPLKSQRYNFLQPIIDAVDRDDIAKAVDATWDLTAALVGEPKGERIWTDGEASIIASAIMSVVYDNRQEENRRYQNLTNVYFFIAEMCKAVNNKMPIIEYVKHLENGHPAKALLAISEVAPSKTRGSFYTAALTTLRLFTNPMINSMSCISDYDPRILADDKTALFIILPDEKTTYYTIASLLVSQHYEQLVNIADERGGRLLNRVNFLLDEFGNFATIPSFANKLTVGGGRGMRFNLFLQGFSQLDEKYDKEVAKTIKGNCQVWIYLQTDDLETLEEISKKLGNYTVSTYSLSSSHAKYSTPSSSHSINLTGRALLTADEVRLISRPYSLITSRSNPAIMYSPDISEWSFNKMLGLGDKEHNRRVREIREKRRKSRAAKLSEMDLWNIWKIYIAYCEQQEQPSNPSLKACIQNTNKGRSAADALFNDQLVDLKECDIKELTDNSF